MTTEEPSLSDSPIYEVHLDDRGMSWNNVAVTCATCGTSERLHLQVRYRIARVDPTAHIICPDGHVTDEHPLVYPDFVLTLFNWLKAEDPRPPLTEALAGWSPHRATWIEPVTEEPEDQRTVFYGKWVHDSDLQQNRDQWPDIVAAAERAWAEAAANEPPLTPWRAAWFYAEMLTDHFGLDPAHRTDEVRAMLARAITIQAGLDGLLRQTGADGQLTEVRVLTPVSLVELCVERLRKPAAVVEFLIPDLGAAPNLVEIGYEPYQRLCKLLAYGAEILDDEELDAEGQRDTRVFSSHADAAFQLVTNVIATKVNIYGDDVTLGQLNKELSQHLAHRAAG